MTTRDTPKRAGGTPGGFLVTDWWAGDPDAVAAGIACLTVLGDLIDGDPHRGDVRNAVAHRQKRWGLTPDGALGATGWARLGHEAQEAEVGQERED